MTRPLAFDDYLRALVYRAFDVRVVDRDEYRHALEDVVDAPGRWPLVRWHIEIAAAHDHTEQLELELIADDEARLCELEAWLEAKGLS
jgi:hypothetical protein